MGFLLLLVLIFKAGAGVPSLDAGLMDNKPVYIIEVNKCDPDDKQHMPFFPETTDDCFFAIQKFKDACFDNKEN